MTTNYLHEILGFRPPVGEQDATVFEKATKSLQDKVRSFAASRMALLRKRDAGLLENSASALREMAQSAEDLQVAENQGEELIKVLVAQLPRLVAQKTLAGLKETRDEHIRNLQSTQSRFDEEYPDLVAKLCDLLSEVSRAQASAQAFNAHLFAIHTKALQVGSFLIARETIGFLSPTILKRTVLVDSSVDRDRVSNPKYAFKDAEFWQQQYPEGTLHPYIPDTSFDRPIPNLNRVDDRVRLPDGKDVLDVPAFSRQHAPSGDGD